MHSKESQPKPQLHEQWIDYHAKQIVKNLQSAGFETYLVGGCVRDLLVGIQPKDFDIATSALPQEVRRKISHAYVIGKRFKLVLVKRDQHLFEIATFRRNASAAEIEALESDENASFDNFFGSVEEDANRRDFTVNAIFYDPIKGQLIDHCSGLKDVEQRYIRMIGEPVARLKEDPIRILRAVRLAHKLNFSLEPNLRQAIKETALELARTALPRRREEWLKILRLKDPQLALVEFFDLGVLEACLPGVNEIFQNPEKLEIFSFYMNRWPYLPIDKQSPSDLFSAFALIVFLANQFGEKSIPVPTPRFEIFMKEELGMFKLESGALFHAMKHLDSLRKPDLYLRKGERRQAAFLKQDNLKLALSLSLINYELSPEQQIFWSEQLKRHAMMPNHAKAESESRS